MLIYLNKNNSKLVAANAVRCNLISIVFYQKMENKHNLFENIGVGVVFH